MKPLANYIEILFCSILPPKPQCIVICVIVYRKVSHKIQFEKMLKVVSAVFLLVCFSSLKESTFETWKKCFLLYCKSSFRSQENQIFEFQTFKFHDVINCLSIKQEIHFTEYLGSKHSLLMKFDQFTLYYKTKNSAKIATFFVCEELSITSIGK